MKLPEMIFFDYGHTLLYEPGWDTKRGNAELLRLATRNPRGVTTDQLDAAARMVYGKNLEQVRGMNCELSGISGDRFLYEYLGLEFDLPSEEVQSHFWYAASPGAIMPDADKIIDCINALGIRSAVISNLLWTGDALRKRLDRLLPQGRFEFVLTSSDYMFRKPSPLLFELALRKAGVDAQTVWHCGDNPRADIEGAASVGIYPVWYDNTELNDRHESSGVTVPACEHLHIHGWSELADILSSF